MSKKKVKASASPKGYAEQARKSPARPAEVSRQPVTRCPEPVYDCLNCRMLQANKCLKLRIDIDLGHPKQNCDYWRKPLPL